VRAFALNRFIQRTRKSRRDHPFICTWFVPGRSFPTTLLGLCVGHRDHRIKEKRIREYPFQYIFRLLCSDRRVHVLIVEDEKRMAELLKSGLEEENHSVSQAFDGRAALEMAQALEYDAIVLDLTLPGIEGFEVARRLRKGGNKTPILILSARDNLSEVVKGLDVGADDYMTKPFAFEELLARLRSVSRRGPVPRPPLLQVGDLVLNTATHEAKRGGQEISLTRTEFRLLEFLMRRVGQVFPRNAIVLSVWGSNDAVHIETVNVVINMLRNKVDRDHGVKLIQTVRGLGYLIRDPAKAK
jgi:DNA-binding response OmpR family regulator